MTPQLPHATELPELPVTTEAAVLDRIAAVVRSASRHQVWFLLFDDQRCQLPVLFPVDLPRRPTDESGHAFGGVIGHLASLDEVAEVVLVYERPGPAAPTRDDLAWLTALEDAIQRAAAPVPGLYFASNPGVRRWDRHQDALRSDAMMQGWPDAAD